MALRRDFVLTLGEVLSLIDSQKVNWYLARRWQGLSLEREIHIKRA